MILPHFQYVCVTVNETHTSDGNVFITTTTHILSGSIFLLSVDDS